MKKQNGITLIALVISIIVLLILVGISLSITIGKNGILNQVKNSVKENRKSKAREEISMAWQGCESEYWSEWAKDSSKTRGDVFNEENLNKYLEGNGHIDPETFTYTEGSNTFIYVSDDNNTCYSVTISSDGKVTILESNGVKVSVWDGTSKEPVEKTNNEIHIYKCSELKWLQEQVNNGNFFNGYTIYLENDLDFGAKPENGNWETAANEARKWIPIGSDAMRFQGKFEGNNHTIIGIYVNDTTTDTGLFGDASDIKNLTLKDSYIKGNEFCGGIAGYILGNSIIENCHSIDTVVNGTANVGGIIGGAGTNSSIINCSNKGIINGNTDLIGGIAGYTRGQIRSCTNLGKINTSNGEFVGGIAGYIYSNSTITDCSNKAQILANSDLGGIVGGAETNSSIINCSNKGMINGNTDFIGGIAGYSYGKIEKSINEGDVSGKTGNIGGIVGLLGGTVEKCVNKGNVTHKAGTKENLGGIAGGTSTNATIKIMNCCNFGKVTEENNNATGIGGIVGWVSMSGSSGIITNNYSAGEIEIKGSNCAGIGGAIGRTGGDSFVTRYNYYEKDKANVTLNNLGEGLTTVEMKSETLVNKLNSGQNPAVWELGTSNDGYPTLK